MNEDYYKGIPKLYFDGILKKIIQIGDLTNLSEFKLILDFGCGYKHLRKQLPNKFIIGYDKNIDLTEINDYRNLIPEVIVCNAVLQYFTPKQLIELISDFKKMNKNAKLIVGTPKENLFSKIGSNIFNHSAHEGILLKKEDIYKILEQKCKLIKKLNVFNLSEVSLWEFKK